jgi:uncharacterized protein (DUF2141 family)
MTSVKLLGAALLVASSILAPQQVPTRDTPAQPSIGTAVIAGTVVTDNASAQPIRHATVSLNNSDVRRTMVSATNDAGEFAFADLPAGHYTLSAFRGGYSTGYYGARQSWKSPGASIVLADGQRVIATLRMMHGSVLSGIVTDAYGRPVPNFRVVAMRARVSGGERQFESTFTGGSPTDDRGRYRLYGLTPGNYVVAVSVPSVAQARQISPAEIQWALQMLRGGSQTAAPRPEPPPGPTSSYAPIFYPGTADSSAATVIALGPDESRDGLDFSVDRVQTSRVDGTVVDVDGRPAVGATLTMLSKRGIVILGGQSISSARVDAAGKFSFASVQPGEYTLVARLAAASVAGAAAPPSTAPSPKWAQEEIRVSGGDITGLSLQLQPPLSVTGRLIFDGSTPPPDLTRMRVSLDSMPVSSGAMGIGTPPLVNNSDGTFTIQNAMPGPYRIVAFIPPPPGAVAPTWFLKSATVDGVETLDSYLEMSPRDLSGLLLTFTDHPSELNGRLLDPAGRPTGDYSIVAFSTDRKFWTLGSRRVRTVRPDSQAKFKIVNLPPGEYYTIALTDLDSADLADPTFLDQLASAASYKITLADGEKKTQDLKLSGGG